MIYVCVDPTEERKCYGENSLALCDRLRTGKSDRPGRSNQFQKWRPLNRPDNQVKRQNPDDQDGVRGDKTGLYRALIKAEKTEEDVSETTGNALRGGGRYEINLTDRLAAFGSADFKHNEIQLLDRRMVLGGGGPGYYLKKRERSQFQVFGGGAYNYENFSTT
jgi:hypothetical protein